MLAMASDGKRVFFGVRVSVPTANSLARCVETLARRAKDQRLDLKWVAPTSYHVTLKFVGWTQVDAIGALRDSVGAAIAGIAPFKFRTTRIGAFASLDKATVVWAGIDDTSGSLTELAKRIDTACAALGVAPDTRAFHPHVTLARLREARVVRDVVLPMAEQMFSDTHVDGVTLFESETKSSGSVYKEISQIGFKTAETEQKRQTGALLVGNATADPDTDDGWPSGAAPSEEEMNR